MPHLLKASNSEMYDVFGNDVAVAGTTIIVGAGGEDSSATDSGGNQTDNSAPHAGAAYVFRGLRTTTPMQVYVPLIQR